MEKKEFSFLSADNKTNIHAVLWLPDGEIKGIVQVIHGITEHILRYEEFAKYLINKNIAVVGSDLIGHGLSISETPLYFGSVGSWNYVVQDTLELKKIIKEKIGIDNFILLGFSLGSFVARTIMIAHPKEYEKIILLGTGYLSNIEYKLANFMTDKEIKKVGDDKCTPIIKSLAFDTYNKKFKPNKTEFDWLCSNEDSLKQYIEDELSYKTITSGLFRELLYGMYYTCNKNNIKKISNDVNILMMSGKNDAVGKNGKGIKKVFELYKNNNIKNIELKLYDNCRHDLLHEYNYDIIYNDIYEWINNL